MKHWQFINSYKPDYLILLGDNVYGDFNDKEARNLHNAYNKLNENNTIVDSKKQSKYSLFGMIMIME